MLQYPVFDDRYKEKTPKEQTAMLKEEYEPLFDKVEGINLIVGLREMVDLTKTVTRPTYQYDE